MRGQETFAGTAAQSRRRWEIGARECTERINQRIAIFYPTSVKTLLFVDVIVNTNQVLPVVEWIVGLENSVVRDSRVVKERSPLFH